MCIENGKPNLYITRLFRLRSDVTLTEGFALIPGVIPSSVDASNFFGGYAPDSNHRTALAKERGIGPQDLFALLREFGGSIAGALSFRSPDEAPSHHPRYEPVDDREIARLLQQAIDKHDRRRRSCLLKQVREFLADHQCPPGMRMPRTKHMAGR